MLDDWIVDQNVEADEEGMRRADKCLIRLLGQTALLEHRELVKSGPRLTLAVTNDVDCYADYGWSVEQQFRQLLLKQGKELDPLGHEVWMPRETRYTPAFSGAYVTVALADIDAVLLSKALKAPHKNRYIIVEYLAHGASERFVRLAAKYNLDLESFV